MTCKECSRTMVLWHDNKYHCSYCGKIVERPEKEGGGQDGLEKI